MLVDRYIVVVNEEGQYALSHKDQEVPLGWHQAGEVGTRAECLSYIASVWKDMRPLSVRNRTEPSRKTADQ